MTNWFSSRSRWKTISPVSGHLIQRFCGTSRLEERKPRIFGRTTLLIQLTLKPSLRRLGAGGANAVAELLDEAGYGGNGPLTRPSGAIERIAHQIDQSRPHHD